MKKAFSIIELSLVILVVGIIIAGITQGSRVIFAMRLSLARAQTESSDVNAISGLVLWLDAVSEGSFSSAQSRDGAQITAWYDRNINGQPRKTASVLYKSDIITYKKSAINNLPALYFNGIEMGMDGVMTMPALRSKNNYFTAFIVAQNLASVFESGRFAFYNGDPGNSGYGYVITPDLKRNMLFGGVSLNSSETNLANNYPEIISLGTKGIDLLFEVNNVVQDVPSAASFPASLNDSDLLSIGSSYDGVNAWQGYISEIIIFNRILEESEKNAVKNYLSKKYNIKL